MNYYTFDKIVKDDLGCYWGYLNQAFCEVFLKSEDDTEESLEDDGFAKCDAPGWETMVVEESSFRSLTR